MNNIYEKKIATRERLRKIEMMSGERDEEEKKILLEDNLDTLVEMKATTVNSKE